MDTLRIIQEIDAEISRLQQVKAILRGTAAKRGPGRPKTTEAATIAVAAKPRGHVLSAEARAKIAAAQKARWAKSKRADKKEAKKGAAVRKPVSVKTTPATKVKASKPGKAAKTVKEDKPESQS